ncbi:MAG: lipopolysaccharide biosynthesis protein [Erysipelotrichaceae bacterium]|nr:lipopolysaccharide biosynthesis protein [Erysipelotrichaceae bacterium]
MEAELSTKEMAANTAWNTFGTFFYFMCQWLLTVAVVRLSGYKDAGIFSIVLSVTNVFYCISMYGIRNYQVTDIDGQYSDLDYLRTRHLSTLAALILFGTVLFFLNLEPYTLACCWIYLVYKFEESYTDVIFGTFQKYNHYKPIAVSYVWKGILSLVSFCAVLVLTKSLFWTLTANVVLMAAVILFYDWRYMPKMKKEAYRGWTLFVSCFPLMLYSMLVPYLNFVTRYAVERAFGQEQLGYYSSITMVLSVLMVMMNSVFVTIIPKIAADYENGRLNAIFRLLLLAAAGFIGLDLAGQIGGWLLGDFCFSLVFGDEILPYMYLLPGTIHCAVILAAVTFASSVLTSLRKTGQVLAGNALSPVLCTLMLPWMIGMQKMEGALNSMTVSLAASLAVLCVMLVWDLASSSKNKTAESKGGL